MAMSHVETDELLQSDSLFYYSQMNKIIAQVQPEFDRAVRSYVRFNLFFLSLGGVELVLLAVFFAHLAHSSLLALSLAGVFLTFFSYFMLRMYFQTKKGEFLHRLTREYGDICKQVVHYQEGEAEDHIALSNAFSKWATALQSREYGYYRPPGWLEVLAPSMERWSCFWFKEDLFRLRELLLQASVDEHIRLVKCEPTSLEAHAALANAYVMLSGLYADAKRLDREEEESWATNQEHIQTMEQKFRATAERAIEEFKILNDYAPDDPWVHAQLAYSYHDLQMPKEEMREYETILTLRPDDKETMYKLGVLYFQQGLNAKGLRIYEKLKRVYYSQAERLIEYYGIYQHSKSQG